MKKDTEKWQMTVDYDLAVNMRPHIASEVSVDYTGYYIAIVMGLKTDVNQGKW